RNRLLRRRVPQGRGHVRGCDQDIWKPGQDPASGALGARPGGAGPAAHHRGRNGTGGEMSKETAFYPRLKALTDQWMDLFGYWAPSVGTDTLEEDRAVPATAGLVDFCIPRKYDIEGKGALDGINRLVTRNVANLQPGHI